MLELIGLSVGLFLGILGASGGFLTIPLLQASGINFSDASFMSLVAICSASFIGAIISACKGHISFKTVGYVFLGSLISSSLGILVSKSVPTIFTTSIFVVLAILIALKGFSPNKFNIPFKESSNNKLTLISFGAIGGFLTGLLGIGGGFIYVPLYRFVLKMDMQKAVCHSLATISLTTLITIILKSLHETPNYHLIISFSGLAMIGVVLGFLIIKKLNTNFVEKAFSILLLISSIYMGVNAFIIKPQTIAIEDLSIHSSQEEKINSCKDEFVPEASLNNVLFTSEVDFKDTQSLKNKEIKSINKKK